VSVDLRTRLDAEQAPIHAGQFFRERLPDLFDAAQAEIAPGARALPLRPFCIETDGEPWTLAWSHDRVSVSSGPKGQSRVRLCAEQLTDIVNDQSTPIALMSTAQLDMPEGGLADFLNWWLVLRSAIDRRPIHVRGDVKFSSEIRRSFTPEDSDEEMRAFLEDTGYLHIKGLFSEDEMAEVEADFPVAAPHFEKGDPKAWFATTRDGVEHLVRMEGFDRYSPATSALIDEERFQRLGRIPGIGHVSVRRPGARVAALSKPIGVVKGISDIPWHKDCSLGRHAYECCSLTVGISVNGADAESGQLRLVPGSHRALVWPAPCIQPGLDLEAIELPTRTGDVTIHLSCTQHMSQPPKRRTRKVLYTNFGLEPRDAEATQRYRLRLDAVRGKTHTRVSQEPGHLGE